MGRVPWWQSDESQGRGLLPQAPDRGHQAEATRQRPHPRVFRVLGF